MSSLEQRFLKPEYPQERPWLPLPGVYSMTDECACPELAVNVELLFARFCQDFSLPGQSYSAEPQCMFSLEMNISVFLQNLL